MMFALRINAKPYRFGSVFRGFLKALSIIVAIEGA